MTEVVINVGICVPPVLRKRGRPKGHEMTAISIPEAKDRAEGKDGTLFETAHFNKGERYSMSNYFDAVVMGNEWAVVLNRWLVPLSGCGV